MLCINLTWYMDTLVLDTDGVYTIHGWYKAYDVAVVIFINDLCILGPVCRVSDLGSHVKRIRPCQVMKKEPFNE